MRSSCKRNSSIFINTQRNSWWTRINHQWSTATWSHLLQKESHNPQCCYFRKNERNLTQIGALRKQYPFPSLSRQVDLRFQWIQYYSIPRRCFIFWSRGSRRGTYYSKVPHQPSRKSENVGGKFEAFRFFLAMKSLHLRLQWKNFKNVGGFLGPKCVVLCAHLPNLWHPSGVASQLLRKLFSDCRSDMCDLVLLVVLYSVLLSYALGITSVLSDTTSMQVFAIHVHQPFTLCLP